MHTSSPFVQTTLPALHGLMREHPLATLVVVGADGPVVDHVPLLLDAARGAHGVLIGHVARANALWHTLEPSTPVTAVFHGPACYVSPSWYASKQEHGRVVPTWNYAVVHARGRARTIHEPVALRAIVEALTTEHERGFAMPWKVSDAPDEFIESMLRGIVGLEIGIEALEGKWKASQNRPVADRHNVARELRAAGTDAGHAMAALVDPDIRGVKA